MAGATFSPECRVGAGELGPPSAQSTGSSQDRLPSRRPHLSQVVPLGLVLAPDRGRWAGPSKCSMLRAETLLKRGR